jgi:hypothetical protein
VLESANFPKAITIEDRAFSMCYALTSVTFPEATNIGSRVFYSSSGLTSVSLPKVTKLGDSAFSGCSSLESITILTASKGQLNNAGIRNWGSGLWGSYDDDTNGTTTLTFVKV